MSQLYSIFEEYFLNKTYPCSRALNWKTGEALTSFVTLFFSQALARIPIYLVLYNLKAEVNIQSMYTEKRVLLEQQNVLLLNLVNTNFWLSQ